MPKLMEAATTAKHLPPFFVPRRHRAVAVPPGPSYGIPIRELQRIRVTGLIPYLQGLIREYGNVVRVQCGPLWVYLVNEPEMIRDILQRQYKFFTKGYGANLLKDLAGEGVFFSEGEMHRQQRKLMQPAFHKDCLCRYADHMVDCVGNVQSSWSDGQVINIAEAMNRMTLDVVVRCLFGSRVDEDSRAIGDSLGIIFEIAMEHLLSPLGAYALHLPTSSTRRYKQSLHTLDQIIGRLIHEHQRQDTVFDDLMSILTQASDEGGEKLSFRQLRDEAMTLFIAGHETTAIALSWAWYEIARHPEIQSKLQQEVDAVLQGENPTFEHIPRLKYCRKLMQESMRQYPPIYLFFRQAREDVVIGDFTLPKGAHVLLSPYITHRDPRFFPCPDLFLPDRWTPEFEAQLPKFTFFPFSGGPRVCLGEHFAWTEGILALASLAQRWHFRLEPHQSIGYGKAATLRPEPGIDLRIRARGGAGERFMDLTGTEQR